MKKRSKYCLLGIPDHEAVFNLGGRIGSALGPEYFRKAWKKFNGDIDLHQHVQDLGDVELGSEDVEKNHRIAIKEIAKAHEKYDRSIVVGGAHDHGYTHLAGVKEALSKKKKKKSLRLGCINIDAHLDVRAPSPKISSGSPFYLAVTQKVVKGSDLVEFGIQRHCNAPELWDFAKKNKMPIVPMSKLRSGKAVSQFKTRLKALSAKVDAVVISFDIDAVAGTYAPGVSAPQPEGLHPEETAQMMEIAGNEKKVVSLGLFELNPLHDIGEMTSKLAAVSAYHFVAGPN